MNLRYLAVYTIDELPSVYICFFKSLGMSWLWYYVCLPLMQKIRDCRMCIPKGKIYSITPLSRLRNHCRAVGERNIWTWGHWRLQGKLPSAYRKKLHKWTQSVWDSMCKPRGSPRQRKSLQAERSLEQNPTPCMELLEICSYWKRENSFL